jgi:undecaprenyl diphosphate synthase
MQPWKGHWEGVKNLEKRLNDCMKLGIKEVSVYTLSTENLKRPKRELDELFKIFYNYLDRLEKDKDGLLDKYQIRVRFIGDIERLPPKLVRAMGKIMQRTAKYQKRVLNLLIAYSSKFEIKEAIKSIAKKMIRAGRIEISERDIEKNLLVKTPVDLLIRTGGMTRLSNFLLWQTSYAELYFTETLWPDFTRKELVKSINWFNRQKRNFGA